MQRKGCLRALYSGMHGFHRGVCKLEVMMQNKRSIWQVVWADSDHVGCAATVCSGKREEGKVSGTMMVCNYGPGWDKHFNHFRFVTIYETFIRFIIIIAVEIIAVPSHSKLDPLVPNASTDTFAGMTCATSPENMLGLEIQTIWDANN